MNSLVKNPSRQMRPSGWWPTPLNRFFDNDFYDLWNNTGKTTIPSLNFTEEKDSYKAELAVPGLKKDDFNIEVEGNMVTISCDNEAKTKKTEEDGYSRWEYDYSCFSRSFTVPEHADTEKISAKYNDGVLSVTFPKKPGTEKAASQKIKVQ